MHACIGQDLAAGLDPLGDDPGPDHLYGLVPGGGPGGAARRRGARSRTTRRELDPTSDRGLLGSIPRAVLSAR